MATPVYRTGKICYVEIPASDVQKSADFYQKAFGWQVRRRGDGAIAFDDTVNQVGGTWVTGRRPAAEPGLMIYIMVASASAAVDAVIAAGGQLVQPVNAHAKEVVATFRDPGGNTIGLYEQPGLAATETRGS
ncbi:MAG: VOC family protein [Candidatus Dormibacter sp.]